VEAFLETAATPEKLRTLAVMHDHMATSVTKMFEPLQWPETEDDVAFFSQLEPRLFLIVCLSCKNGVDMPGKSSKSALRTYLGDADSALLAFTSTKIYTNHRQTSCGSVKEGVHHLSSTLGALIKSWKENLRAKMPTKDLAPEVVETNLNKALMRFIKSQPAPAVSHGIHVRLHVHVVKRGVQFCSFTSERPTQRSGMQP
jgi:hypothetical protein